MTTVVTAGSSRLIHWLAVPGFLIGLIVADLWPGIGIPVGIISLLVAVTLFLLPRTPRRTAWVAAGLAAGVGALLLLALLQMLDPNTTPSVGTGSASAPPR